MNLAPIFPNYVSAALRKDYDAVRAIHNLCARYGALPALRSYFRASPDYEEIMYPLDGSRGRPGKLYADDPRTNPAVK
jgi:hypothetical protein